MNISRMVGAVALIALFTATASAASLNMWLEADQVGAGNEYDVRVFALVSGTDTTNSGGGLKSLSFDVISVDTSGVTDAKNVFGSVETTWHTDISGPGFFVIDPLAQDNGSDGDIDAMMASFAYLSGGVNFELGLTETLIATERWIMNSDGPVTTLELIVAPTSEWFDLSTGPVVSGTFDEGITATGITVGVPEPSSVLLVSLALAMLFAAGRCKRRCKP